MISWRRQQSERGTAATGTPLQRRFVLAEQMEADLANGIDINVERHALLCSKLTRLAQRIGIDRRAKNITPTLNDYLSSSKGARGPGGIDDLEAAQ
jgi:hypothetical protein